MNFQLTLEPCRLTDQCEITMVFTTTTHIMYKMLASVTPTNSAHLPTQYDQKPMTEATLQLCFPHRQASKVSPYSMFSIKTAMFSWKTWIKMTDRPTQILLRIGYIVQLYTPFETSNIQQTPCKTCSLKR